MAANADTHDGRAEPSWALARLVTMHDAMRADLAVLQDAVAALTNDTDHPDGAAKALGTLSFRQPGWTLRRFCGGFCEFVHGHHTVESSTLFPLLVQLRGTDDTDLAAVIERLEAEHRTLTSCLDEVEHALLRLPGDAAAGRTATTALARLSELLLAHLAFEEDKLAAALDAMSLAVSEDDLPAPQTPG